MFQLLNHIELLQITMAQLSIGLGLSIGLVAGMILPERFCSLPQPR
jgi:hypothetical protein